MAARGRVRAAAPACGREPEDGCGCSQGDASPTRPLAGSRCADLRFCRSGEGLQARRSARLQRHALRPGHGSSGAADLHRVFLRRLAGCDRAGASQGRPGIPVEVQGRLPRGSDRRAQAGPDRGQRPQLRPVSAPSVVSASRSCGARGEKARSAARAVADKPRFRARVLLAGTEPGRGR